MAPKALSLLVLLAAAAFAVADPPELAGGFDDAAAVLTDAPPDQASPPLPGPYDGMPMGPLTLECRKVLASMFQDAPGNGCMSDGLDRCTTESAGIYSWRLLCLAGVSLPSSLFQLGNSDPVTISWGSVSAGASSFADLIGTVPSSGGGFALGRVGSKLLQIKSDAHLLVLECALSQALDRKTRGNFRRLARRMGYPSGILSSGTAVPSRASARPAATAAGFSSRDVIVLPIMGGHPLLNFGRFQTVYVSNGSTTAQYDFSNPSQNSLVVNTSDSEWLASFNDAPGLYEEGSDFKLVYDSQSAANMMTYKAEAAFNGYGVSVSADFEKVDKAVESATDSYMDFYARKAFTPDYSTFQDLGFPLTTKFKSAVASAVLSNSLNDDFYKTWGNYVVVGFTRAVRFSARVNLRFTSNTVDDQWQASLSGNYENFALDVSVGISLLSSFSSSNGGVRMSSTRDPLPQGYKDSEALSYKCQMPRATTTAINDDWIYDTQTRFENCAAAVGKPTAVFGDRTHAILMPITSLKEFQGAVYDTIVANSSSTNISLPSSLMTELEIANTDEDLQDWIQKLWGRAKAIQKQALRYSLQHPAYNQTDSILSSNSTNSSGLTQAVRANINSCTINGCPSLAAALARIDTQLDDIENTWKADGPLFVRAASLKLRAYKLYSSLLSNQAITASEGRKVAGELNRVINLINTLVNNRTAPSGNVVPLFRDPGFVLNFASYTVPTSPSVVSSNNVLSSISVPDGAVVTLWDVYASGASTGSGATLVLGTGTVSSLVDDFYVSFNDITSGIMVEAVQAMTMSRRYELLDSANKSLDAFEVAALWVRDCYQASGPAAGLANNLPGVAFLDRYWFTCADSNEVLCSWRLNAESFGQVTSTYTCCKIPLLAQQPLTNVSAFTDPASASGFNDVNFLDRHNINCGSSSPPGWIRTFSMVAGYTRETCATWPRSGSLASDISNTTQCLQYRYNCLRPLSSAAARAQTCRRLSTSTVDKTFNANYNGTTTTSGVRALTGIRVECANTERLQQWNFVNVGNTQLRIDYVCCALTLST